jgi:hypothetical protein
MPRALSNYVEMCIICLDFYVLIVIYHMLLLLTHSISLVLNKTD